MLFTEPEPYHNMWVLVYGDSPDAHYRLVVEGGVEGLGYCPPEICNAQLPALRQQKPMGYVHRIRDSVDFPRWLDKFLDDDVDRRARQQPSRGCGCLSWVCAAVDMLKEGGVVGSSLGHEGPGAVDVHAWANTPPFRPNFPVRRRAFVQLPSQQAAGLQRRSSGFSIN